jgi:hypothetical protein
MQPKHAWDKVLKLSGNVEEDFKKVTLLLEKESIFSKECFLRSKEFSQGKIIRSDYQKTINGQKIQAVFETYVETNQIFLQDQQTVAVLLIYMIRLQPEAAINFLRSEILQVIY